MPDGPSFHYALTLAHLGLGALTWLALLFVVAPYGRHERGGWGPSLGARNGWLLMESPAVFAFAAFYALGEHRFDPAPLLFLGIWMLHYLYRALVFPFRLSPPDKPMPWLVVGLGFGFNLLNAYVNARWISGFGEYPTAWLLSPVFWIGLVLFAGGLQINRRADARLRGLRRPGERGYVIPHGGLYNFVSCPNYLGEIIEWCGWAVMTWSLSGFAFAFYTVANLAPRARSNHRWYRSRFPDYPAHRRALVPWLW